MNKEATLDKWAEGFEEACVARGVDPVELLKVAGIGSAVFGPAKAWLMSKGTQLAEAAVPKVIKSIPAVPGGVAHGVELTGVDALKHMGSTAGKAINDAAARFGQFAQKHPYRATAAATLPISAVANIPNAQRLGSALGAASVPQGESISDASLAAVRAARQAQSDKILRVAALNADVAKSNAPVSLMEQFRALDPETQAAILGGGAGLVGGGAIGGMMDPGEDEEGRPKSRIGRILAGAGLGAVGGAGAGVAGHRWGTV